MDEEVLHPWCTEGNMVEFAHELLCLLHLERVAVRSPGGLEEGYGVGDEFQWDSEGQSVEVEDETQYSVHWCDKELVQLAPIDGVLVECHVGLTEQDEDCFDAGSNGLLGLTDISDVEINVVLNVDTMRCRCWGAVGVGDALVDRIMDGPCECGAFLAAKGMAPLDLIKDGTVLQDQGGVKEEALG